MQSLNISSSALRSVQLALDNASNNLANLDTVGYKRRDSSFSELLLDNIKDQPPVDKQRTTPPGLRIGSGVKLGMTKLNLSQGSAKITEVPSDLMIEGDGYFVVKRRYTDNTGTFNKEEFRLIRNGNFHLTASNPDDPTAPSHLVTAEGDILVDDMGIELEFPPDGKFTVTSDGEIWVNGENKGIKIPIKKIDNPDQYQQLGNNEYLLNLDAGQTVDSLKAAGTSTIRQGALEMSNVDMQKEMTNLIMTQRAFQLNSRAIGISDQMMNIANSIRSR